MNKQRDLLEVLGPYPIIASVKNEAALSAAMKSACPVIAILYGDVTTISDIVALAKQSEKKVLVNLDMVDGYSARTTAVRHLAATTSLDGVLSSKSVLVRAAREEGIVAIQRFFMVDSFAYHQLEPQMRNSKPDFLEILPGCVPRVIGWIREQSDIRLIAGGLVCDPYDVKAALTAGANAVATSDQSLWNLVR